MTKTFYSVQHATWGADKPSTKWFDNLAEAQAFAAQDYSDAPKTHNFKNAARIKEIELLIAQQETF